MTSKEDLFLDYHWLTVDSYDGPMADMFQQLWGDKDFYHYSNNVLMKPFSSLPEYVFHAIVSLIQEHEDTFPEMINSFYGLHKVYKQL